MRRILLRLTFLCVVAAAGGRAQKINPIQWSLSLEPSTAPPGARVLARLQARLEPGWHLYSLSTPRPPIATTISLAPGAAARLQVYAPAPKRKFDPNFGVETETYDGDTEFLLAVDLQPDAAAGDAELTAQVRYQACTDKLCLPPVRRTASATLRIQPGAPSPAFSLPPGYTQFRPAGAGPPAAPPPAQSPQPTQGLARFLLVAFGFGLAAIFTPCVFPMIPITVSFFLGQEAAGRRAVLFHASLFCLGIVVLFTALGITVTALLGPFGVVQLGSNPWVNSFIAAVFLAFALSLLGAFEITLPSGLLTRLDQASRGGGVAGTLLMGLTFSLTSFACVGPFVGTLLAASVQGGRLEPALGMLSFASGLAAPFFLLALFPSFLKKLPRSGGWMMRVKVVLGFLILAAMLKYLSNVDQVLQWNLLTRERFLAGWVVLLALPGLYLLGWLRLEGIQPDQRLGITRLLTGAAFLILAASLLPGMFGARLGELDAFVPPPSPSISAPGASAGGGAGPAWMKNQLPEALEAARRDGKRVLLSFTGYACTNCHWMKANLFPRPEIVRALRDYVLVELYTDGADEASRRNQEIQQRRFATIAIPFYVVLDSADQPIRTFAGLTRDSREFLAFLAP